MRPYRNLHRSKTFREKPKAVQELIETALYILDVFGIPMEGSPRRLERMALAFLACGDVKSLGDLPKTKDLTDGFALKTRDIIDYANEHFNESTSSGSYDDVRRKDLKLLTIAEVVLRSSPNAATNDSTRGYSINPLYSELLRSFGQKDWETSVREKLKNTEPLSQKLKRERQLLKVEVVLASGRRLLFSPGKHNDLQKAIIEGFLPRYGFGAEVLYVGDTADKYLHLEKEKLVQLDFFEISHEELPDIIAYSPQRNWIYLIEAVHSSGPISEIRLLQLQKLAKNCKTEIVYVTAFADRATFRKFTADIAWETEVWIADSPDHLIHFNGDRFLGPYGNE